MFGKELAISKKGKKRTIPFFSLINFIAFKRDDSGRIKIKQKILQIR
jgi:hypothetical protein